MTVAFAFLAGMTLVSALGVVLSRSVVHSALFMSGSFLGISGYFVMLNAPALAAFQVLIYVGAVTVVILFGIMFTQKPQENWGATRAGNGPREVAAFGRDLLGVSQGAEIFTLLFEVASVLLLVAVVAAIVVSRRKMGQGVDRGVRE